MNGHFNSRPSARGDISLSMYPEDLKHFNSRPSARGDTKRSLRVCGFPAFQFTPLREGRLEESNIAAPIFDFNSRPSARGDPPCVLLPQTRSPFQFTPLREGRQRGDGVIRLAYNFNSRPSARGDHIHPRWEFFQAISIHAPPRGATSAADAGRNASSFQFTPLREGRPSSGGSGFLRLRISIHAPPRGATPAPSSAGSLSSYFNSRPSARGDSRNAQRNTSIQYFNSRPSARGDHAGRAVPRVPDDFNSRPSARGDGPSSGGLNRRCISIHAPPRGATSVTAPSRTSAQFQFTPLREGRRQKICNFCKSFVQPLQISMA